MQLQAEDEEGNGGRETPLTTTVHKKKVEEGNLQSHATKDVTTL